MMRRPLLCLALSATVSISTRADDAPAAKATQQVQAYEALKKECDTAVESWWQELVASVAKAKKGGKEGTSSFEKENPGGRYAPRYLALAEQDPTGPAAFKAIKAALETAGMPKAKDPSWCGGVKLLRAHYLKSPEIKHVLKLLSRVREDDGTMIREVIAQNPDRQIQAWGYLVLIDVRMSTVDFLNRYNSDPKERARLEELMPKEKLTSLIANAEKESREVDGFKKILHDQYADIVVDLEIGQSAPEVVGEDVGGKTTRLSELRGKVVVLDIWATWCGPCKAMIPHEREMVARLKDKPFALVSISVDEEKKTLTDFLAKEPMPWTHWWNGAEGKVIETLSVVHYPTIFVLDAQGVIRYKEIRGEELEKAVGELLKEMETKKTAAR